MHGDVERLEAGTRVGAYSIERFVRRGAKASVYRAVQPGLDRTVALHVAASPSGTASFVAEAKALAGYDHPNLVPVYETGSEDGIVFAASGLADAEPLADLLARGPLDSANALAIAEQVAGVLDALDGTPYATTDPRAILVVGEKDRPRAYLSPLESDAAEVSGSSAVKIAQLLESMVDGSDLADVIARAGREEYPSASAVVDAARATLAPRRRRLSPTLIAAGLAVIAIAAVAAVLLSGSDESRPRAPAPAAKLVATIGLGASPASVGFADGSVWVGTDDRRLVRVDPRSNRVIGSPIRFASNGDPSNITVRAGAGSVYAMDGNAGLIVRVDPATGRIVRRRQWNATLQALAVDGSRLWIARTNPPGKAHADEVFALDARTLRPIGRPAAVASIPLDVEVAGNGVFATSLNDGTITRVDARTRRTTQVWPATRTGNGAIGAGKFWVPSPIEGIVTPLDADDLHVAGPVVRIRRPASVVALGDSLWVVESLGDNVEGAPALLQRIDPANGRLLGAPLRLGKDVGWPAAGAGSLWIPAVSRHALLRVRATSPVPGARATTPAPDGVLRSGPVKRGRWHTATAGVKFSLALPDSHWSAAVLHGPIEMVELRPFRDPSVNLAFVVDDQMLSPDGDIRPLRTAQQLIDLAHTHPHLYASDVRTIKLGDREARSIVLRIKPYRDSPPNCPSVCVLLYARGGVTGGLVGRYSEQLTAVDGAKGPLVITLDADRAVLDRFAPVVQSVRIG